jgi:hypothetical protein
MPAPCHVAPWPAGRRAGGRAGGRTVLRKALVGSGLGVRLEARRDTLVGEVIPIDRPEKRVLLDRLLLACVLGRFPANRRPAACEHISAHAQARIATLPHPKPHLPSNRTGRQAERVARQVK